MRQRSEKYNAPEPGYTLPVPPKHTAVNGVISFETSPVPTEERPAHMRQRTRVALLVLIAVAAALLMIVAVRAVGTATTGAADLTDPVVASPVAAAAPGEVTTEPWNGEGEDPQEAEKIEEALLAQGYLSTAVPLDYTLQDIMRTACTEYGCPYPLALAVAEVESNFNMDTIGAAGEVGIMQLNPGPGGSYHAELTAATGRDPATPEGNIYCGVYLLGKYMADYQDPTKAAMAYNMGVSGARTAWAAGITSTNYTKEVLEAMEKWETTVNAWCGE